MKISSLISSIVGSTFIITGILLFLVSLLDISIGNGDIYYFNPFIFLLLTLAGFMIARENIRYTNKTLTISGAFVFPIAIFLNVIATLFIAPLGLLLVAFIPGSNTGEGWGLAIITMFLSLIITSTLFPLILLIIRKIGILKFILMAFLTAVISIVIQNFFLTEYYAFTIFDALF